MTGAPGSRVRRALQAAALLLVLGAAPGTGRAESPSINYLLHCRGCHLPDGSGTPGRVPALRDRVGRFLAVPGGREYLVRVPGSAQSPLDDASLAALLNWIIREFGPADAAERLQPYSAAEVAGLRSAPLVEVEAVRAVLVAAMAEEPARSNPD